MQNRIYWMLGAALVLLVAIFVFQQTDGDSEIGTRLVEDRAFKVEDMDQVHKIFIADRKGYTTKLVKQPDGNWELDDQYLAYDNALKNLLDAIENIDMQFIPANKSVPTIIRNLASEGIHVEIFNKRGDKIKGYYIGGSTQDERGTYAIMEDAEQPYVVHIPGWTGNLRFRYSLLDQEWRDKKLFATPIEEIELVSIEYPTQRNRSFVLEREGDKYMIGPYYETGQPRREVPRGRAEAFLVNFEASFLSEYMTENLDAKAAHMKMLPFATLRLERKDGTQKDVKFYPRINGLYEALDPNTDAFVSALGERGFNLLINDNEDFAIAQSVAMSKLLKTYMNF